MVPDRKAAGHTVNPTPQKPEPLEVEAVCDRAPQAIEDLEMINCRRIMQQERPAAITPGRTAASVAQ